MNAAKILHLQILTLQSSLITEIRDFNNYTLKKCNAFNFKRAKVHLNTKLKVFNVKRF